MKKLSYQDVKDKIVRLNNQNVILDYAVADDNCYSRCRCEYANVR